MDRTLCLPNLFLTKEALYPRIGMVLGTFRERKISTEKEDDLLGV